MTRVSNLSKLEVAEVVRALNSKATILETAMYLGVAPGTLYRFIRKHELKRLVRVTWLAPNQSMTAGGG